MLVISTTILFLGFCISTASTTLLAPRYTPVNNLCPASNKWYRRECAEFQGMTRWRDVCYASGMPGFDYEYSDCPDYFLCSDIVDARGDRTIKCVPINQPDNTSPRTTDGDPQIGTSYTILANSGTRVTQLDFRVTIANDMSASVSAIFLSESYVKLFWAIHANDL